MPPFRAGHGTRRRLFGKGMAPVEGIAGGTRISGAMRQFCSGGWSLTAGGEAVMRLT